MKQACSMLHFELLRGVDQMIWKTALHLFCRWHATHPQTHAHTDLRSTCIFALNATGVWKSPWHQHAPQRWQKKLVQLKLAPTNSETSLFFKIITVTSFGWAHSQLSAIKTRNRVQALMRSTSFHFEKDMRKFEKKKHPSSIGTLIVSLCSFSMAQ